MASGDPSLRLTTRVSWESFATYARHVVGLLGGTIEDQVDSPVERVWGVTIGGRQFWIAFDDFGLGISLEPRDSRAATLIPEIRAQLMTHR